MNRLELFRTLRRHVKLSEKRSIAFEQNRTAKIVMYVMSGCMIIYLLFIAVALAMIANNSRSFTPYEIIFGLLPFMLTIDFLVRFMAQQTPSQLIKPYILLPIPKHACVESFILSSMVSTNNLLWMFITVPYAIMTMLFGYGIGAVAGFIVTFQLIIIINSLNYMLWRTLISNMFIWWIAPICIYGSMFIPWITNDIDYMFKIYSAIGTGASEGNPMVYIGIIALIALYFFINRKVQYEVTYKESTNATEHEMKKVSDFRQLERFGEVGEYLKLEVKSTMRNKNIRKSFITSMIVVIMFSMLISFTDIYSDSFSKKFWIVYTFILYGSISLIKIMSGEGNYIDCLMSHRENIIQLLKAKYYIYSSMLLLPFMLMLPTVFMGKYSLITLVSMLLFTAGPIYCMLMQMAVYNKQTMPLNTKFIAKGNIETNWFQVVAELLAMFAPVVIISLLMISFSENTAYIILGTIGLIFIALHNIWIRNIYNRFMARRYTNMESFRATR